MQKTYHEEDKCEVDPITSPSFGPFHTYIYVVDADFAKKGARCVELLHFYCDPRVRQEVMVGAESPSARSNFIAMKTVSYIF